MILFEVLYVSVQASIRVNDAPKSVNAQTTVSTNLNAARKMTMSGFACKPR